MSDGMIPSDETEVMREVASHFAFEGRLIHAEPYGCGHINDTHCLWFDRGSFPPVRYILQKINTGIFRDVDGLMNNITLVTDHIRKKLAAEIRRLQKEIGFTMVMVTHNQNIADMANTVISMNSGRIITEYNNSDPKSAYEIAW